MVETENHCKFIIIWMMNITILIFDIAGKGEGNSMLKPIKLHNYKTPEKSVDLSKMAIKISNIRQANIPKVCVDCLTHGCEPTNCCNDNTLHCKLDCCPPV